MNPLPQSRRWKHTLAGLLTKPTLRSQHQYRLIAVLCLWFCMASGMYWYLEQSNQSASMLAIQFLHRIENTMWAPVILVLGYVFRLVILCPATLFSVLSGALFGFFEGICYSIIGINLAAATDFKCTGWFWQGKQVSFPGIEKVFRNVHAQPFLCILTARFSPLPFDLVNVVAALQKVRFKVFAGATLIGTLIDIGISVSFGASLKLEVLLSEGPSKQSFNCWQLGISLLLTGVMLLVMKYREGRTKN